MASGETILVLAGAREAHGVVAGLVARERHVIVSLPEPERMFDPFPVPTRQGPFPDVNALRDWVSDQGVVAVIDASHAFDDTVSTRAACVSDDLGLRYLRVMRPPWQASGLDHWTHCPSVRAAVRAVPIGACAFTNTGRATLPEYAGFCGAKLYVRQTRMPGDPPLFPFVQYVAGQPPFSNQEEEALLRELGVTHLICRNVGGEASRSKLIAARALGLHVLMIERAPVPLGCDVAETIDTALAWEANR